MAVAFVVRFVIPANAADTRLYLCVGALVPLAWVALIAVNRAYERRFVGVGQAEFERVFRSFLHITALFAFGAYATKAEIARGFILLALPLALVLGLIGRYAMRKRLHALRRRGLAGVSVLAVGDGQAVTDFMVLLERDRYAGMNVVGACLAGAPDDNTGGLDEIDVPLLHDADSIVDFAHAVNADTVAVVSSGQITPERLRWISWQLEGTEIDLVVSPGLMEVAGPRLHIQPVGGLPLLHVEQPDFAGFRRFLKGTFDRAAALAALVMLSPVFALVWLQVRLSSPGPALFRQTRVGRDGREFTMWKFRSMYVDSESRLAELRTHNVNSDGLLFKVPDDPRVTRVGKVLRRFSLDELPQLFNVVAGQMSLVGPRPPLPAEVERYGDDVRRRLLVKPGVTGLWQVSGRSNLSWAESVRLDLRYVENWSPALDLMILWKTLRAVISSSGAY